MLSVGVFSILLPVAAFAAGVINTDPSPWGTGITTVSIAPSNVIGISKTANAQPGDVVAVNVYYHNKGDQSINNFKIQISKPSTGASTSFSVRGTLSGNGVSTVSDTASININSSQTLTFIPGSVRWFPNQTGGTNTSGQTISSAQENALVGGSGFDIGTLTPGWSSQGGIVAHFQVGSNSNPNPNPTGIAPNVSTSQYSGMTSTAGSVTLRGNYNANGYATTTSFQYRMNGGSWMTMCSTNQGTGAGSISCPLSNLATGTYEYKALASNAYGSVEGSIFTFSINRTTTCPSGTFENNGTCVQNCPSNSYWNGSVCVQNTVNCPSGYYLSGNTCIQNVTNCPSGYYLSGNTCIQNQVCNSNQYWNGSYCVNNVVTTNRPTVSTLGTISVGATAVAIDGYYTANGCDAYTSFNYGTTQSLGNRTNEVNRGNNSGSMAQSLSGLLANTTYYYQASARNCVGTTVGSIRSFTTSNNTVNDTVIIQNVTTGTGGNAFVKLMITNNRESVRANKEMDYEVSWENVSGRDLKNIVLEINFPDQVSVIDTDRGQIKREAHSVVYKIDTLDKAEKGDMTIAAEVTSGLRDGDPVVAQAILAFENPKTGTAENAIAYDADEFSTLNSGSVLGASLFGLDFLPTSLAGWLLVLLLLAVLVILGHSYVTRQRTVVAPVAPAPVAQPSAGTAPMNIPTDNGTDYVVYRPNPKQ